MVDNEQKILSLSELCSLIEDNLEYTMPGTFRVRAEISSMNIRGGHCYLEFVEKAEDTSILSAKMRAVCWSNVWNMISAYFLDETGKMLSPGMQILAEGNIVFHPVYSLSFQLTGIDPSFTLGDLALQRQKTIKRLQDDGVFDLQRSLILPTLPKRIAVVSSPDAAGYGDFSHQLQSSGFLFSTTLFPAIMQGDRSAASVVEAMGKVFEKQDDFDVVVIIRGGGASTDLSCFDNYELASHIAQFPLPIITGIGHQRDVSVADMVAFKSEKTPTATAEFLISKMQREQDALNMLRTRLFASADKRVALQKEKLNTVLLKFRSLYSLYFNQQHNRLQMAEKTLTLLSPADIYKKGYSLTLHNGQVLTDPSQVATGDIITTELAGGTLQSVVDKK